ncbi:aconitate hydratase [Rhodohalobacter sp. SW132]|uniref:aconitate hydratase n=1 Tax=Rhodohalobacter sp. SW132 TaxID=2293433 RepID=UPI000E27BE00|nr:aconitate hydratase [Rhodohalobacter sp. SW132]REL37621.1 aconitate hydratase [Rhodohalobacter sp. SW132]
MGRPLNVTEKLIESHLVDGELKAGEEIGIKIDQTLTQDATGTLVMLELEAMDLDKAKTDVSCQYVDHNLLQTDFKNPDDHLFLKSAAERFGLWYSRPGNGVSHPVHTEHFAKPGKTLAGSDSHTPASGCMGMFALGAGGLDVAFAIAGEPMYLKMPKVLGVKLTGKLPDWVSAKDVVLEMLRRYDVKGARGFVIEYYGPGLDQLSTMDRHVIANMGTEMGATTTVFPSDGEVKRFLKEQGREEDWTELLPDEGASYDEHEEIVLDEVEPLIALPSSPGNVVPVREVEGREIYQSYIGSSANPSYRDFWMTSEIVKGKRISDEVSFDINPTSRQIIENMVKNGVMLHLVQSGARIHQAGCNGCIGMGQAPASGRNSLRTVPRNFPDRSGTKEDSVYLCSPETAAASALTGEITDPRDLEKLYDMKYPKFSEPEEVIINRDMLIAPPKNGEQKDLVKGPNISTLPDFSEFSDFEVSVLLKMGDNVSTDEILRAGADVLPFRSNIPEISKFSFSVIDESFYDRAMETKKTNGGHVVVAGDNYAQGSSREHAAIAPRYLGQRAVIAKSYARIGWQNLINFGIAPLEFKNPDDYDKIEQGDTLKVEGIRDQMKSGHEVTVTNLTKGFEFKAGHTLSDRQLIALLDGGIINTFKKRH